MGADETFGRDTDDRAVVLRELLRLSAKVTGRMRAAGVAGRTVTLKVRFADFTTITRSRTLGDATDVTGEVHATAAALFDALGLQRARIRLVGVRVEGLVPREQVQRQLVSGPASGAGRRPTGPPTPRRCGSAAAPYAGPRCSSATDPETALAPSGHDPGSGTARPKLRSRFPDPSTDFTRPCLDS